MPRFFFTVRNGSVIKDARGTDLPDEVAAQREALQYAAQLMSHPGDEIWDGTVWHVDVSGEDGIILFSIEFTVRMRRRPLS